MTLDEFRADGTLVSQWHEVLKLPITQIVLGLAAQEAPQHRIIKSDITDTFAITRLGHIAGWAEHEKFLTETVLLSTKKTEPLEQTYEPPEEESQTQ